MVPGSPGSHPHHFPFLCHFALLLESFPHLLRMPETHFQSIIDLHLDFGSLAVLLLKLVDFVEIVLQFVQVGRPQHVFQGLHISLSGTFARDLQRLLFQTRVEACQTSIDVLCHLAIAVELLLLQCVLVL